LRLSLLLSMIPFELERTICSKLNASFGRRPSSAPLLSGDTYRRLSTIAYDDSASPDASLVIRNSKLFVSANRLREFLAEIFPRIDSPFIAITHQGDLNIGEEFRAFADDPRVLHWFAQNCLLEHPKVTPLPIGLEDRWRHNNGEYRAFMRLLKNSPQIPAIGYSFSLTTNLERRLSCYKSLQRSAAGTELPQPLNSQEYRRVAGRYMFIASPPGNGLDCHRTWEALYMGCVPIVEDNYMNRSFLEHGLPIVLVREWNEVREWDEGYLKALYARLGGGTRPKALFSAFWEESFAGYRA